MPTPLLTLQDLELRFGARPLFSEITLSLSKGERICLVGRNGTGKSTLMKVIAGAVEPDSGRLWSQPGTRVAYLVQEPDLAGFATVRDFVCAGLVPGQRLEPYEAETELLALGIDPDRAPEGMSGGETRRVALAGLLAAEADVLLVDEPTNHLDLDSIAYIEDRLKRYRGALVVISHDRAFLSAVTNTTLWLDRGVLRRNEKGFEDFERWQEEVFQKEATERAKLDKLIAEETVWSVQGISARRKRNQGRLRRLYDLRAERADQVKRVGLADIRMDAGEASGKLVLEATSISKTYGGRPIVKDFSTKVLRGDRLGIVGPNGAGKSTLLKMLTGSLTPDTGTVRLGTKLEMVYLDQTRSSLDLSKTLWQTLCPLGGDQVMVGEKPRHVVAYLKDFLFEEGQARSPVSSLSGGERNRLVLSRALAQPSNFLILDEPTNDLDLDTLDLLQEVLTDYSGTLIIVSHDRDFLDRTVTSTIVFDGPHGTVPGRVMEYPGGYTDAMVQRKNDTDPKSKGRTVPQEKEGAPPTSTSTKAEGASKKLSYKDQRELGELPDRLAKLEKDIATFEAALADPTLYTDDPQKAGKFAKALETKRSELAAAEDRWLELEALEEELS